jgi:hypothetical protein
MRILTSVALLLLGAGVASLVAGCGATGPTVRGSGVVASEARAISGFHSIDLAGFGDVRVEQTGGESVTVEAEDNLLPLLVTTVDNGRLRLGVKDNVNVRPTRPVVFHVTVDRLEAASVSGSGDITVTALKTRKLSAHTSGSGSVKVDALETERVDGHISGSGSARLAGRADDASLSVSGSGSYHAAGLQCRSASITISGSGSATVNATRELTVDVSGSGSVQYLGAPQISTHVSGSGSVSRSRANAG